MSGGANDHLDKKSDNKHKNSTSRILASEQNDRLPEDISLATDNRPTGASASAPIDIRQASCGKFGVFTARSPPPPPQIDPSTGLMVDTNGVPVPIDKLIKTANSMSSLMMAHKIALEEDFKLEPGMDISGPLMSLSPIIGSSPRNSARESRQGEPSLHSRVKDIVHEAYWDLFKEELESQRSEDLDVRKYDLCKQLLCDIKQKIFELLLPQHERLKQDVDERLDSKIIDQLARVHTFKPIDYGLYILSVMSKLCAPIRDERLKELSLTTDVVQMYRGIMELLEQMRLDFANFTLNQFKPHIKAHSQDYEREKFNEILKQQKTIGIDGLEYTRIWLGRAVERVNANHGISELVNDSSLDQGTIQVEQSEAGSSNQDDLNQLVNRKHQKILRSDIVNRVLNTAFCELLEWRPQMQKLYPESLLFDESTFKQLSEQYKILLLTASILLTTFAFVNRFKIPDSNEFKVLLKSHIITLLTATYDVPSPNVTSESDLSKHQQHQYSIDERMDALKLETVAIKVIDDIRHKIEESNMSLLQSFQDQKDLLTRQILDLQSSQNRVRELTRRRLLEFVETLLDLDVKHQQEKFPSKMPPPVNIPLGLNCLTDEITLTMAQLVKIIRYNRRVFFHHYEEIISEQVSKHI